MRKTILFLALLFCANVVFAQKKPVTQKAKQKPKTIPILQPTPKEDDDNMEGGGIALLPPVQFDGSFSLPAIKGKPKKKAEYELRGEKRNYYFYDSVIVNVSMPESEVLNIKITKRNETEVLSCDRKGTGTCAFDLKPLPDGVYQVGFYSKNELLHSILFNKYPPAESADR